jgi:hypothetical protein
MPGKVYCFNCHRETISQLLVNGLPASTIAGWTIPGYTPASLPVDRIRRSDGRTPAFPIDRPTALELRWQSFTGKVSIPAVSPFDSPVSLDDDLVLYMTLNGAILLTTRGSVMSMSDVSLTA